MLGYYNQKDYAFVIVALVQTLPEKQSEMKVTGNGQIRGRETRTYLQSVWAKETWLLGRTSPFRQSLRLDKWM